MTPTIAAFHGAGIPVGNVSSFMSGRTGTCGGSIPPAALTKSVAPKRSPLAVFRTRTHHLVEGVRQEVRHRNLTPASMVRFHHSLPLTAEKAALSGGEYK